MKPQANRTGRKRPGHCGSNFDDAGRQPAALIGRRQFLGRTAAAGVTGLSAGMIGSAHPALAHLGAPSACSWPTTATVTASGAVNQIADLPYSDGTYIQARLALNVDDSEGVEIGDVLRNGMAAPGEDAIITNLSDAYAYVTLKIGGSEGMSKSLSPRSATIIRGPAKVLKAAAAEMPSGGGSSGPLHLAFIRTASLRNLANALGNGSIWRSYSAEGCWPQGVGPYPLWMSARAQVKGLNLSFDPWRVSNQATPSGKGAMNFDIHTNLWWLPAMSDAAVHHCHYQDFIEIHTQLMGIGRMQKFTDSVERKDCPSPEVFDLPAVGPAPSGAYYGSSGLTDINPAFPGMYEEYRLAPGDTNVPFAHVDDNGKFVYPWHQYYADTDCLWAVWEMVPSA